MLLICCYLAFQVAMLRPGDVESRSFKVLKSKGHYQRILNEKLSVLSVITRHGCYVVSPHPRFHCSACTGSWASERWVCMKCWSFHAVQRLVNSRCWHETPKMEATSKYPETPEELRSWLGVTGA